MQKTFQHEPCTWCGLLYQPVDWQPWRRARLCSERCAEAMAHSIGDRQPESLDLPDFSPQTALF